MLIKSLPDKRLDHGLAAHVEILSGAIQFFQHSRGQVYINALNRLDHPPLALKEARNVLPLNCLVLSLLSMPPAAARVNEPARKVGGGTKMKVRIAGQYGSHGEAFQARIFGAVQAKAPADVRS